MPWQETNKMDQRTKFIREVLRGEKPFKHVCKDFGISEKTGYKWKNRFFDHGKDGLEDQSRRPLKSPNQIDGDTVAELVGIKQKHSSWGPKKILVIYKKKHPQAKGLSLSSVKRIFKKSGNIEKRKIRKVLTPECPRLQQQLKAENPNDVWCIDFKGWWKSEGEICEPFTVRDKFSRKILCARLMRSKSAEDVRVVMTELFQQYGLPKAIHSDNGSPFATHRGLLNLTTLSAWWISLGIMPDRSLKGCPGQNGSLERMHADIAREIENKVPGGIEGNQKALDLWVEEYNSIRPNEAIEMKVPDEVYRKSEIKYRGDYDEIEYPMGYLVRKVSGSGTIQFDGIRVFVGTAFRGYQIGLRPRKESNLYDTFLGEFLLGTIDMNTYCITPINNL